MSTSVLELWGETGNANAAGAQPGSDSDDDGGGDTEEPSRGSLPAATDDELRSTAKLRTLGDVVATIRAQATQQLEAARDGGAQPNVPVRGDARLRAMTYTLLPLEYQRLFFLELASDSRMWPRLRCFFGAPPYAFLMPTDAWGLNATGICKSRVSVAFSSKQIAMSYAQFGMAQMLDMYGRQYRVSDDAAADAHPVSADALRASNRGVAQLIVRLPKRSRLQRSKLLATAEGRRACSFPAHTEQLVVQETAQSMRLRGSEAATEARLVVMRCVPRGKAASTALLLCRVQ